MFKSNAISQTQLLKPQTIHHPPTHPPTHHLFPIYNDTTITHLNTHHLKTPTMSSTISLLTPTALKAFNLAVPSTTTAKVLKSAASSDSGLSDGEDAASSVASNASKVSEAIDAASTLPSEVVPQVLRLIETFPTPTAFGVCTDEHTGCMKPCCIAATAYMEGAVAASAARLGTP